jgi:hypothetical protein
MILGLVLIIVGFGVRLYGGILTKKYIFANNPEAKLFTPEQLKAEWNRVAQTGSVVPSWVPLLTMGAWVLMIGGLVLIAQSLYLALTF